MTASSVPALSIHSLAPVRVPKARVISPMADVPKPTSAQITLAINTIDASAWLDQITPLLPSVVRQRKGFYPGGRKPEMTLNALLVGCLLLTIMERPFILRDVHRLLNEGIDAGTRKRLGLPLKRAITERMVSRLFNILAGLVNKSVYFESNAWLFDLEKVRKFLRLDDDVELSQWEHAHFIDTALNENAAQLEVFIRNGLRATHPKDSAHSGDYAIDGSYISSWEKPATTRRAKYYKSSEGRQGLKPKKPHHFADPDAKWWSKQGGGSTAKRGELAGKSSSGLGYVINAIVWAEEDLGPNNRGADIPNLIEHISVISGGSNIEDEGSNLIDRMVAHHEREDLADGKEHRQRGDILADREYTRVDRWQKRMHQAGFTPHFLLAAEQRGLTDTLASGILIIDGIPYSPGIPVELHTKILPTLFMTREQRSIHAELYSRLKPYRIRANTNGRADDGSIKAYCPASNQAKGSVSCQNKPASIPGRLDRIEIGTALPVIINKPMPSICSQTTVTIDFDEMPFWQPHIPGTPEHQWSVNRRNVVESAFSRIKDEATQSVRRGQFRLMGRAKVSLATLFYSMAANLVETQRWQMRQAGVVSLDAAREIKIRTPRRHTRNRMKTAQRRQERIELAKVVSQYKHLGLTLDAQTGEVTKNDKAPPG